MVSPDQCGENSDSVFCYYTCTCIVIISQEFDVNERIESLKWFERGFQHGSSFSSYEYWKAVHKVCILHVYTVYHST